MTITATSKAEGLDVSVDNVIHQPSVTVKERKALLIATYDETTYTTLAEDTPMPFNNDAEVGAISGFGFLAHRMAKAFHKQVPDMAFDMIFVAENGSAAQSTGNLSFTGTSTETGYINLYISNEKIGNGIVIPKGTNGTATAALVNTAINGEQDCPLTSAVDGVDDTQLNLTAKTGGPQGDYISLEYNLGFNESTVAGITAGAVDMSSGSGVPDLDGAISALGAGDNQNQNDYTAIVHCNMLDETTLDDFSEYNGVGDQEVGNYGGQVARPFNVFIGDVTNGTTIPSALTTQTGINKEDRTNCIVPVPGSPNHPIEIACQAMGVSESLARIRPGESAENKLLVGVSPYNGEVWTDHYSQRDIAVKSGLSTTKGKSGSVYIGDLITLYRPDSVPIQNNGYREVRNCKITQNILHSKKLWFGTSEWDGISLVENVSLVDDFDAKEKVKDIPMITTSTIQLITKWEGMSWIYSAAFSIEKILSNVPNYISIRDDGLGFDIKIPVVYSGMGKTRTVKTQFDVALTVFIS